MGPHWCTLRQHHPGVRPHRRRSRRPGILIRRWWSCTRWRRAMPFGSWCSNSAGGAASVVPRQRVSVGWLTAELVSASGFRPHRIKVNLEFICPRRIFFGNECFVCEGAIDGEPQRVASCTPTGRALPITRRGSAGRWSISASPVTTTARSATRGPRRRSGRPAEGRRGSCLPRSRTSRKPF